MVGAGQGSTVTRIRIANARAAVSAGVMKGADFVVCAARYNNAIRPHIPCQPPRYREEYSALTGGRFPPGWPAASAFHSDCRNWQDIHREDTDIRDRTRNLGNSQASFVIRKKIVHWRAVEIQILNAFFKSINNASNQFLFG